MDSPGETKTKGKIDTVKIFYKFIPKKLDVLLKRTLFRISRI